MTTPPRRNSTEPAITPPPGATALTVAINVTASPPRDGLSDEVRSVVVLAAVTVCITAAEALATNPPPPEYCTHSACVPAAREDRLTLPCPSASGTTATLTPSLSSVTDPLGTPTPLETPMVNDTVWPYVDGPAAKDCSDATVDRGTTVSTPLLSVTA